MKSFPEPSSALPWSPGDLAPASSGSLRQPGSDVLTIFSSERRREDSESDINQPIVSPAPFRDSQPWSPHDLLQIAPAVLPIVAAPNFHSATTRPFDPVRQIEAENERLRENARTQANEILANARIEAERIILQAHKEGWAAAETETSAMLETAKAIVDQVSAWREELLVQSETVVIGLVKEIGRKLFGDGLALDSTVLQQTFNRVMENARSLGDLSIYVHPDDATNLGAYWREFQVSISGHQIQIIPSTAIRRGGCFIEGQWGTVDGRIETQLKAIMDALSPENTPEGGAA
ncbi:MAG: FliH/SctL family protein [Chloroflexi bacterium]|nr:FliH/SctL family protein [Chloroflexota bacterium]